MRWWREAGAGAVGQLVQLSPVLTLGLLAYAPLGAIAIQIGLPAVFAATAFGAALFARLSGTGMPTVGPSLACSVILASLIAQLAADPGVRLAEPAHVAQIVAVTAACVVLMGALQIAFGALRLGSLAKFVPQPVLAGLMNGVAVLMMLAQVPLLLGIDHAAWQADWWGALGRAQPATLAVGLATALGAWLLAWWRPRLPSVLIGLVGGTLLYGLLHAWKPGLALGPQIGALPHALPLPAAWLPLFDGGAAELLWRHLRAVVLSALVLAIIASLDSILNSLQIDQERFARVEPNRELYAQGAANLVVGSFGGVPLVYARARAMATLRAGGHTWRAALAGPLMLLAMLGWGGPVVERIPVAVLAALMWLGAFGLIDGWSRRLLRQVFDGDRSSDVRASLAVVAIVFAVTLLAGFIAAVAVGVLLSMLLFIRAMNGSLLRAHHSGAARPSRRVYPAALEAVLHGARERIVVLELEGALFFGSADRLAIEAERLAQGRDVLVLDLKRVSTIDASGAVQLERLAARLRERGVLLTLAGVTDHNHIGRALQAFGALRTEARDDWFPDADHAVEGAERFLLERAGLAEAQQHMPLEASDLVRGLDAEQLALVRARLRPRPLAAGEALFREGDPGEGLYVLLDGSITVLSRADGQRRLPQRFVSVSAGMMLGEMAMLDGGGRTADALADTASLVCELTRADLAALSVLDAALGVQIYRNIARHLADRLRIASAAWRAA